jgi:hypothetical protein
MVLGRLAIPGYDFAAGPLNIVVAPSAKTQARPKMKKVPKTRKFFLHFHFPPAIINKLFIWNYNEQGGAASHGKV